MARRTSSAREMPSLRAIASSAPRSFSGISTIVLTSEVYHSSLSYKPVSSTSLKSVKEARSKAAGHRPGSKAEGHRPGSTAVGRRSERERSESLPCTVTDSLSCRPEMNTSGSLTEQQAVGPAQTDRSEAKGTPRVQALIALSSTLEPGTRNFFLPFPVLHET
jgi:hypothetical protein